MRSTMEYKGYLGIIFYSDEDKSFYGHVLCADDIVYFEGTSVKELEETFHSALEDYFALCEEEEREPVKPILGEFQAKIAPEQLAEEIFEKHPDISHREVETLLQVCGHDPGEDGSEHKFWGQWYALKKGEEVLVKRETHSIFLSSR